MVQHNGAWGVFGCTNFGECEGSRLPYGHCIAYAPKKTLPIVVRVEVNTGRWRPLYQTYPGVWVHKTNGKHYY